MANNRYSQVKAKRVTKGLAAGATGGGGSITVSDTAPSGPSAGDLWFDSTVLRTYVYYNDGSSSQWVLSNPVGLKGPTGAAGSDGSSVSIYATIDNLPLTGNTAGDQAYVTAVNRFYIFNGTGWYSISLVNTNPNITSVADASSNTTPFTLSTDGSASVITITATDPEDVPLTYTYSVTSGSLSNGGGTTATVVQGTGSNTNKFTVTPSTTEAYAGTFSLTFTASDGINTATSANSFTLNFITIVTNSKYTTLLATATGTSDNNNIADTSSNNHSITVTGDAYAGTFSPYRHGGYSAYFGTGGSERITIEGTKSTLAGANADFSIGAWIYPTAGNDKWIYSTNVSNNLQAGWHDLYLEGSTKLVWRHSDGSTHRSMMSTNPVSLNEWSYILINRTSNVTYMYINGSLVVQNSDMTYALYTHTNAPSIGIRRFYDNGTTGLDFEGYITDVHVKTAAISSPTTVPTERAVADSDTWLLTAHLPYFGDGSSNNYTVSAYNNVSTKPYTQYDNLEYASADHGGSVYFDGNGDRLTIGGSSSDFNLGTNSFTIESWVYSTVAAVGPMFNTHRAGTGSGYYLALLANGAINWGNYVDGTGDITTAASAFTQNTWNHISLNRDASSSNSLKIYVNGILKYTGTSATDYNTFGYGPFVGAYDPGGSQFYFTGYTSDIVVVNGSVLRTGGTSVGDVAFTPPTTPISTPSNTKLHIKGTDASIIDKSQSSNLKMFGNSTGSTTQVKFAGSKSMYFAGSLHDKVIAYAARDVDIPGNGEYTFEAWCYFNSVSGVIHMLSSADVTNRIAFELRNSKLAAMVGGSVIQSGSQVLSTGQWYHLAISRVTGSPYSTTRFFVNGNLDQTATNYQQSPAIDGFNEWIIGSPSPNNLGNGYNEVTGYMQDVRFTEGLGRYTANFTPPTASLEG